MTISDKHTQHVAFDDLQNVDSHTGCRCDQHDISVDCVVLVDHPQHGEVD